MPSRAGTFSQAAVELGYTQSAVSQQIAGLERIIGERLIERPGGTRAASLTEAGATLLRHAEAIMARLDAARADIAALRAGEAGNLHVGTYQSIGARLLPAVMRPFLIDWPAGDARPVGAAHRPGAVRPARERRGRPRLLQPAAFERSVRGDRADERPVRPPRPGLRAPGGPGPLTLDDLGEIPIIGCAATGVKLEDALRATGHKLEFAFRSDSNATLQALVAAGYGVALIPLLAVTPGDEERVKVVNLTPAIPSRRLAVAWHRDRHRSLAARALIDIARAASAELVRELLRLQSVPSTVPGNA